LSWNVVEKWALKILKRNVHQIVKEQRSDLPLFLMPCRWVGCFRVDLTRTTAAAAADVVAIGADFTMW